MQRSGSQKVLLVLSIIDIIGAALMLLAGLAVMLGGAAIGAVDPMEASAALEGTGVTQGQAGMLVGIGGFFIIIGGAVELIMGILGIRAANDNQKIMPVWVLAIISLIFSVIGLISAIAGGTFATQGASAIVSLIIAGLMMWIANNIKQEAGK
ncbi:MAG: hypothetical protein E7Z99_06180 [Coriobacteriaceae bacterium]|nr:hypothetical protein [Coriobacteriaceae bacterium]